MIPNELKQLKNWCVWVYQERDGKQTKVPVDVNTGELAKSNDPSTWAEYDDAFKTWNSTNADGMGFFFTKPYVGIDLDHIDDDLERYQKGDYEKNMVFEFYETFKSYAEISPSGTGLHIIAKGKIPGARRRKDNVEIYDGGRFFTVTGNTLGKYNDISEVSDSNFSRIYRKYLPDNVQQVSFNEHGIAHNLSESEVIDRALNSKQSEQFRTFLNGGWENFYTSQSEADMAFANLLAFWCARDFVQMDSIFRRSSLMRDKWDEKRGKATYGESTLYKAINDTGDVYTPTNKTEPLKYDLSFLNNKQEAEKEYPPRSWDDTGNAERFLDRYGDIVKYSYINKKFYVYDGTKWTVDNRGLVNKLIDSAVNDMKNEKIIVPDDDKGDLQAKFMEFIKKSRSTKSKKNIQEELKHLTAVLPDEFDQDDMLINVQNGYLDLSSGHMDSHDKLKMFFKQTNAEYTDTMQPSAWIDFLSDIFDGNEEMITYLQKAIGYSLTGSTREQIMFICHGKGRNGKSLFIETLSEILGDYASTIRASSLMVKTNDGPGNDIARLQNARFVTSSEPNEGFRFDEGLVKQLTGGDKVTARFLYGEDFEFTPKFKIWVTTNHKPIIRGTDDGIWRRMIMIPFKVQIPKEKVDKDLKYKLLREAPAILDWALEGCLKWQREGLELPAEIAKASDEYRTDMDVLEHFVSDHCERIEGGRAAAGDLYEIYKKWADDSGEYKMNKNTFGKKMKEKFKKKTVSGRFFYEGLVIKEKYPGLKTI